VGVRGSRFGAAFGELRRRLTAQMAAIRTLHVASESEFPPSASQLGLSPDWLVVAPARGQRLYRLVGRDPPRDRDFLSDRAKGRPRFENDLETDHLGVSMFAAETQALSMARRYPKLVASVDLMPDHGFALARTLLDVEGHYTVWGEPDGLLNHVSSISREDES
jgi:hypothetical protein